MPVHNSTDLALYLKVSVIGLMDFVIVVAFKLCLCHILFCCIKDCLPALRADCPGHVATQQEVTLTQCNRELYSYEHISAVFTLMLEYFCSISCIVITKPTYLLKAYSCPPKTNPWRKVFLGFLSRKPFLISLLPSFLPSCKRRADTRLPDGKI